MRRKFLASILALCMMMSLLPMTAFATAPTDAKEIKTAGTWAEKVYSVTLGNEDTAAKTELDKATDSSSLVLQDEAGNSVNNSTATVAYEGGVLSLTFTAELETTTDYFVEVTDSNSAKTYVKVTVAAKSNDATLKSMAVSNGVSLDFDAQTTSYTAEVANTVDSVTVTPTVNNTNATVKVGKDAVTSGQADRKSVV